MALSDIVSRTRSIVYGTGLGELPAIRQAAADASESTSGQTVDFDMASGEAAKIKAGDILGVYDPSTEADAHVVYVLSISSDTITGVNSYLGSPAIGDGDLDSALLEQKPLVTNYEIFEAIDTVFANLLWPDIYDIVSTTIASPDLTYGQEAVAAEAEEILHAWQLIGSEIVNIPSSRIPLEVSTSLASTGKLADFDWFNGSTGYYTYRAKFVEADEADTELTHLVALGAAALTLGGNLMPATLEATKKDNSEAVGRRQSAASSLWRDFLTLKQNMSEELSKRLPPQVVINRG